MSTTACNNDNGNGATMPNLKHIYFFIEKNIDTHVGEKIAVTSSDDSTKIRSRASSPGSNGTNTATGTSFTTSNSDMNPCAEVFKPKSGPSPVPPEPSATNLFELRSTENKGLGLFATTHIKLGALILREEPLIKISQNALHLVWGPYCRLGNAQKAAYDSLSYVTPPDHDFKQASLCHLIDRNDESLDEEDKAEMIADQARVMSIFATNTFQLPPSGLAVYATASRLNHSCTPNVHHSYNPTLKKITVHAIRDILPNEELFTTYLGGSGAYQVSSQRNQELQSRYDFTCQCPACSDLSGASDGRRELMSNLTYGLVQYSEGNITPHPFIPTHPMAALKQAELLLDVMLAEGIVGIELTKAYRTASNQALHLKNFELALEYARNEAEVERNCMGTVLNDLRKLGVTAECWIERVFEAMRVERGEDAVTAHRDAVKREKRREQKLRKRKGWAKMPAKSGDVAGYAVREKDQE